MWFELRLGSPAEFWQQTPRSFVLAVEGGNNAVIRDQNDQIRAAYLTAFLPHMKRPPKLRELLIKPTKSAPKRKQSWQEMYAAMSMWIGATAETASPARPARLPGAGYRLPKPPKAT